MPKLKMHAATQPHKTFRKTSKGRADARRASRLEAGDPERTVISDESALMTHYANEFTFLNHARPSKFGDEELTKV